MSAYRLKLSLQFGSEDEAFIIYRAIVPDLKSKHKRSQTTVSREGNEIRLNIVASDATALRASFNSVAKHIALSKEIIDKFHAQNFRRF
jgi:tRNA threonylcarbamoyladenosine modification (KEOPS) complex  Pcc1 subunit